jgi:hypothetical protein
MYILSTVHVACRWVLIKNAFIDHADSRETTVIYLVQSPLWLTVLAAVVFTVNTLVSDSILVFDLPNAWFYNSCPFPDLALLDCVESAVEDNYFANVLHRRRGR